jgi:ADP-ribose pyrophosphatase YjhB (NUDIX family)
MNKYSLILIPIIFNESGEILLVKRNREPEREKWSLPGGTGALDKEVNPEKAVAREVFQDFGSKYIDFRIYSIKFSDKPEPILRLYYLGRIKKAPRIESLKTIRELKWFSISEISKIELAFGEFDRDVIKNLNFLNR